MKYFDDIWKDAMVAERQFKSVYGDITPDEINPSILEDALTLEELETINNNKNYI